MIRPIATLGDPVLQQIAREVDPDALRSPEIQAVIDDMVSTLKGTTGVGLAAPQISQSLRICIVDKPLTVLVNPVLTPVGDETDVSTEGCLSVPGMTGKVRRPLTVRVQALDRKGKPIDMVWTAFRAIVVQHEVDHLDGILYVEKAEYTDKIAPAPRAQKPLTPRLGPDGKKTVVVDSEKPVGGKQHFAFTFGESGRVTGLRIQPGGAMVTGVYLAGMRLKKKDYPAGAAEQSILGAEGLLVSKGDQLRIELRMPKGKRRIVAEADWDSL